MRESAAAVQQYHAATRHTPERLAASAHRPDLASWPRPDKRYHGVEAVALPTTFPESGTSARDALSGRLAAEVLPLDLAGLARLLFYSYGVTRRWRRAGREIPFRAAGSAGALYPVEAYVVCGDLEGLAAGIYHFEGVGFVLQALRSGDFRAALAEAAADPLLGRAPLTVVLTGVPWRTTWKYRARGWRHLFWDAGVVAAHLLAVAAAAGQPAEVRTAFADVAVARLVGVTSGEAPAQGGEAPVALVTVGEAGEPAPPAPALHPLGLTVEPLSRTVVDEPLLWQAHRAGDLAEPGQVEAWRAAVAVDAGLPAAHDVSAPAIGDEPLEDVVLRRGSTRAFTHDAVPFEAFAWPLAVAGRAVPADFVRAGRSLLSHHVAVHAVGGVAAAAYRWAEGRHELVRTPARREDTAFLCLGQPLGGDAAYTAFHSADLGPLLAAAGARGYRAAQLEAGIASGRVQLAAFAAGAGATGLTFFDHAVAASFETTAEPMLCTAVGVPAYRSRPGRRPAERLRA